MELTPERAEEIARKHLGPNLRDESSDPEERARLDRSLEEWRAREATARPEATEEQEKNWERWRDSEMQRIRREAGENTE